MMFSVLNGTDGAFRRPGTPPRKPTGTLVQKPTGNNPFARRGQSPRPASPSPPTTPLPTPPRAPPKIDIKVSDKIKYEVTDISTFSSEDIKQRLKLGQDSDKNEPISVASMELLNHEKEIPTTIHCVKLDTSLNLVIKIPHTTSVIFLNNTFGNDEVESAVVVNEVDEALYECGTLDTETIVPANPAEWPPNKSLQLSRLKVSSFYIVQKEAKYMLPNEKGSDKLKPNEDGVYSLILLYVYVNVFQKDKYVLQKIHIADGERFNYKIVKGDYFEMQFKEGLSAVSYEEGYDIY